MSLDSAIQMLRNEIGMISEMAMVDGVTLRYIVQYLNIVTCKLGHSILEATENSHGTFTLSALPSAKTYSSTLILKEFYSLEYFRKFVENHAYNLRATL